MGIRHDIHFIDRLNGMIVAINKSNTPAKFKEAYHKDWEWFMRQVTKYNNKEMPQERAEELFKCFGPDWNRQFDHEVKDNLFKFVHTNYVSMLCSTDNPMCDAVTRLQRITNDADYTVALLNMNLVSIEQIVSIPVNIYKLAQNYNVNDGRIHRHDQMRNLYNISYILNTESAGRDPNTISARAIQKVQEVMNIEANINWNYTNNLVYWLFVDKGDFGVNREFANLTPRDLPNYLLSSNYYLDVENNQLISVTKTLEDPKMHKALSKIELSRILWEVSDYKLIQTIKDNVGNPEKFKYDTGNLRYRNRDEANQILSEISHLGTFMAMYTREVNTLEPTGIASGNIHTSGAKSKSTSTRIRKTPKTIKDIFSLFGSKPG